MKSDGSPWDVGPTADEAPDPFATMIQQSGGKLGATMALTNTADPRWSPPTTTMITIAKQLAVRLEVEDSDDIDGSNESEHVLGCDLEISLDPATPFECTAERGRIHGTVVRVE